MATAEATKVRPRDRLVLDPVSWQDYTRFLDLFAERPAWRLTYDGGVLEIMSPSGTHESSVDLLARFVDVLTEELDLPVKAGASTTFRLKKEQKGLEPDRSWWIATEGLVRSKREVDLSQDPPPDLCIEVDVTHSSLDRMRIYAALGVPEVWHLTEHGLTFNVLKKKSYAAKPVSLAFPLITPADLLTHLALLGQMDNTAIVRKFRTWVRQRLDASDKS
jgi:Uma2 family endonuclease